jgi:LuxR family transcriptional regulator, maltose regulon positive regulatory protein
VRPRGPINGDLVPPFLEAKLAAPRPRTETLQRSRILRALDGGDGAVLTLVSAPPGYGKTTAVRAWCHDRQAAFAWVTLDAGDNDPVRLWRYLAESVDRVREGLGRGALQRLKLPGLAIEDAIDELANGVAAYGDELVVVADDVQTVTDEECLASLDYFVERLPSTSRLVVITRTDPSLKLARLRANGGLAELRASDLAFTSAEARTFLVERHRLDLGPDELDVLLERTEGWPAALALAELWLRTLGDPGRAVRDFGGDQRFVAEYLSEEVLGRLDDDARSFLLGASVLGRFTADLCDGVFDRSDSAIVLAELERSNLFVIRLEHGGWFRIHSLFAEFAAFQLAAMQPDAALGIHRRAAEWLRARGLVVEAAEHAAAAGDRDLVAQLLLEFHSVLITSGGARTLLRWVRELPDELLVEHPELAGAAATAAVLAGEPSIERHRFLRLVSRAKAERPESFDPYVEAVAGTVRASCVDGGVTEALIDGAHAVELAEKVADNVLVAALGGYARALYFAGELDQAWAVALRSMEHEHAEFRPPAHAFARSTLALVAADQRRLASARAHADKAKAIVGRDGSSRTWLGANAAAAMGVVLAGEGRLPEAEHELASAEHFFRDELAGVHHTWLLLLLAEVRGRRGRLEEADAALRRAREELAELRDGGRIPALAERVERELDAARARAGNGELLEPPSEAELAVLRLLVTDMSAREIAQRLYLSPNTVRSHSRAIYRKLGVNSRGDAVARAEALGLLAQTGSPM